MIRSRIASFFEPDTVAVVGVSRNADAVGRQVWSNVLHGGFRGRAYAVNPKLESLDGQRVYASVSALPEPIDLVIIAVPAAHVPAVIADCGKRSVRSAIVLSAGFAEAGDQGEQLQRALLDEARRQGVRILGPNCLGLMRAPILLNASFSRGIELRGKLALVSQSGAICSAIVDWAQARRIGFSTVVSLGAAADVGAGEVLDYLALDPETDAILLYTEGVDHARSFVSGLRAAARVKPVIVVKAGRHSAAGQAAVSHTGAIVGDDAVFDAALRRAGAVRVETLHELFAAAEVLAHAPRARGNRLAVITNAGGLGVLAVDRAEDLGLVIAKLSDETHDALRTLLPKHASANNPIDILGDAPPERFGAVLELCMADAGVDGIVLLLSPQQMTHPDEVANRLAACEARSDKPVLACFMGGAQIEAARAELVKHDVSCFDSPEAAVEAFATLAAYCHNQELSMQMPAPLAHAVAPDIAGARAVIEAALSDGRDTLSQLESQTVLQAFDIPCVPTHRAGNADDAVSAAKTLGYPVALKIDSPDITHKTEVNGVRLNLGDEGQLREAYADVIAQAARRAPEARIHGVVIEAMLQRKDARELLVGVARDRALGPAIALGIGGTLTELFAGAAIALPPLNELLARDMLARSSVAPWLRKFRGMPAVDEDALVRVLLSVSDLVCELPEVSELDINPLLASAQGVVSVDARIVLKRSEPPATRYAHLAISPFPRHLVHTLRLEDGASITVRPIRPDDAQLEDEFVRGLSTRSRYFRFFGGIGKLTPQMLVRFTQLDYDREMALIGVTRHENREQELGVARYLADPDGQGCEFAIVIADAWQRRGLGAQLMNALIDAARAAGLTRMHGEVLAENLPMLGLMQHLGFSIKPHPKDAKLRQVTRALS